MTNSSGKRENMLVNSVFLHSLRDTETTGHDGYQMKLQNANHFLFPRCFSKTNHELSTEIIISY